MTAANNNQESESPLWLGSAARRGDGEALGSGWVDSGDARRPTWLGSTARRSLVLIDMETVPTEQVEESRPADNPIEEPNGHVDGRVAGDLGMQLRVA